MHNKVTFELHSRPGSEISIQKVCHQGEANGKSQKLFPFIKT